ncbi:claudin family member sinuous [Arctopsyche grandis]|uniref:claudin family member sinuous n=1 Tax=Arctopsyche grandis TaxID=121162 RepID=UPI00406D884C
MTDRDAVASLQLPDRLRRTDVIMKKRSLAGNCAIGVFVIALVTVCLAFATPSWLVSDYRITGAKLDRLGLWTHCFRSLPDPLDVYQGRFFVGCRWVYDPFTAGYDRIRGFLLPPFMIATQFFFTLCTIGVVISGILVLLFFLCCGPDQEKFILLIKSIGFILVGAGGCGGLAVIIFAFFGNSDGWMPDHANNYLGWSFGLGVVGAATCIIASILFLTEANIQQKKRERLKESQTRFELAQETKA